MDERELRQDEDEEVEGTEERLPEIVPDENSVSDGVPQRSRSMSIPPYSSAEMRFFSEADDEQLA